MSFVRKRQSCQRDSGGKMKAFSSLRCGVSATVAVAAVVVVIVSLFPAAVEARGNDTDNPHPCLRECRVGQHPQTCEYHFKMEWYYTMSKACYNCPSNITDCYRPDCVPADGVQRPVIVVNRSLPGPSIQVMRAISADRPSRFHLVRHKQSAPFPRQSRDKY